MDMNGTSAITTTEFEMKVFAINDDDLYAAHDAAEARSLWSGMVDDEPEPCIEELTDEQLDVRCPAFDEDERPIPGKTISVREMLEQHGDEPGWLAGMM